MVARLKALRGGGRALGLPAQAGNLGSTR